MEYLRILLPILLVFTFKEVRADEWSQADTYREAAFLSVLSIDWLQTRQIAKNPAKYYETNTLVGSHPTVGQVNRDLALAATLHIGVAYLLPSDWRAAFQYVTIGIETDAVIYNYHIGLSVKF